MNYIYWIFISLYKTDFCKTTSLQSSDFGIWPEQQEPAFET